MCGKSRTPARSLLGHFSVHFGSQHHAFLSGGFVARTDEHRWFASVQPLDHPRFIMQYRRKKLGAYIANYAEVLGSAV